jgi:hypothetical protein
MGRITTRDLKMLAQALVLHYRRCEALGLVRKREEKKGMCHAPKFERRVRSNERR